MVLLVLQSLTATQLPFCHIKTQICLPTVHAQWDGPPYSLLPLILCLLGGGWETEKAWS